MNIQENSPLPSDPFADLEADYGQGVLHLAWDLDTRTKTRTFLFGFVELLPTEIPPPADDYNPREGFRLGSGSAHRLYVRHAVVSAREALDWYLAARLNRAALPDDDGTIPSADSPDSKWLAFADLSEEPPWPTLISLSPDGDAFPFIPQWIRSPRTHHMLPLSQFDRSFWSDQEHKRAQQSLADRLHFDLKNYPHYWGSLHLVAPNPIYRTMKARLQPREPPMESVLLRFRPRMGKSVDGLELSFLERDSWGVTASQDFAVNRSLLRVNLDREVRAVMEEVWDPRRGFLEIAGNANPFCKSIGVNVGFMYRARIRAPGESYDVMRTSGGDSRDVADTVTSPADARSRLLQAHYSREKRRTAEAQGQRWFRDEKEKARELLRGLLNEATHSVLLVDAYFGAMELISFALAVGRDDIPIRILSSAQVLRKSASKDSNTEKGDQLAEALKQLRHHENMNSFEIRVMVGKRPAVHDRLLAVDDRIWLIGSSLNEFGSRGTMILALPDPDAVQGDLLKAWNESQAFETWFDQRRENRRHSDEKRA